MIAFRNLWCNRIYTIINVVGLALGITCACLIYVGITYERNLDSSHSNADLTDRVVEHSHKAYGVQYWNTTAYPLAEALRTEFPGLLVTQTAGPVSRIIHSEDNTGNMRRFEEQNILFVDPHYLQLFDFKSVYADLWLVGNPDKAFRNPSSVVLWMKPVCSYTP